MKLIIENSIKHKVSSSLSKVVTDWNANWNFDVYGIKYVDDITSELYQQINFMKNNVQWKLIFPTEGGTIFFINYNLHKDKIMSYAGGATGDNNRKLDLGDKISIIIFGDESNEILELRIIHELLHAQDLPADDLLNYTSKFLTFWERIVFKWLQYRKLNPEQYPLYQRKYYKWLLAQRKNNLM